MNKKILFLYVNDSKINKHGIMHKVAENLKKRGVEVREIKKNSDVNMILDEILWSDVPIVVKDLEDA